MVRLSAAPCPRSRRAAAAAGRPRARAYPYVQVDAMEAVDRADGVTQLETRAPPHAHAHGTARLVDDHRGPRLIERSALPLPPDADVHVRERSHRQALAERIEPLCGNRGAHLVAGHGAHELALVRVHVDPRMEALPRVRQAAARLAHVSGQFVPLELRIDRPRQRAEPQGSPRQAGRRGERRARSVRRVEARRGDASNQVVAGVVT